MILKVAVVVDSDNVTDWWQQLYSPGPCSGLVIGTCSQVVPSGGQSVNQQTSSEAVETVTLAGYRHSPDHRM